MTQFIIKGPNLLSGEISVSGAKNAALKILPAAILADSPSTITNVPQITDIDHIIKLLESIGTKTEVSNNTVTIDPTNVTSSHPDEKLVKKLRGSIVLMGPLLAKFGRAVFSQPGGCLIGARPIDDHLDVFRQLGVDIQYKDDCYIMSGKPKPGKVVLKAMSVTATENAIMASVLSDGVTTIHIAAAEPEIADLANYLNKMGANIKGAGTHDIVVTGVKSLKGSKYEILPDRIEAGTYLLAALTTNSEVTVGPMIPEHLELVLKKLTDAGAKFEEISRNGRRYLRTIKHNGLTAQDIDTRPYPGFPTDLQSPYAVLMTQAKGDTHIFETIFEGRFRYLEELILMRAKADILNPRTFIIHGPNRLVGTEISSRDLRGGVALILAGLIANGTTIIDQAEYIDRGYERIDEKLRAIGVNIERVETKL
ncbi:MAG: UDP-N-acetylglucosamine 1-carboxyvinyltransferase [bacterium ADurb.Bin400]|nr:MAG: UDP-N-acetylglucosamine 1-carboxyvinyltransferase [bacterium ADurb.Bin400]